MLFILIDLLPLNCCRPAASCCSRRRPWPPFSCNFLGSWICTPGKTFTPISYHQHLQNVPVNSNTKTAHYLKYTKVFMGHFLIFAKMWIHNFIQVYIYIYINIHLYIFREREAWISKYSISINRCRKVFSRQHHLQIGLLHNSISWYPYICKIY